MYIILYKYLNFIISKNPKDKKVISKKKQLI